MTKEYQGENHNEWSDYISLSESRGKYWIGESGNILCEDMGSLVTFSAEV